MKIFFIDGKITSAINEAAEAMHNSPQRLIFRIIDAGDGVESNKGRLQNAKWAAEEIKSNKERYPNNDEYNCELVVLTNSIIALDHEYGWNKEENHSDIYIWGALPFKPHSNREFGFHHIQELTDKEIRKSHNISQMYLNGVFNTNN